MEFSLAPEALAAGYRLITHDSVGSTNADATDRARGGEPGPLWVVSDRQTQGKGRRGNLWQTPPGNLAASLLLTLDEPPAIAATLGFVAGLALLRALDECCPAESGRSREPASFALKWPNDVLADDAKLAGILLESEQGADGRRALVVGTGVNVAHAPAGLAYPTNSLARLGYGVTAAELFGSLSRAWLDLFAVWDGGRGFPTIRDAWLARAGGLGGPVTVRGAHADIRGTFETLDPGGQLVLRLGDGSRRTVSAGDVHFGAAASIRPEAAA